MRKSISVLVLTICISVFFNSPLVAADSELTGEWLGGLVNQSGEGSYDMRLYFLNDGGRLSATFDLPTSQSFDLAFEEVIVQGETLELRRQNSRGDKIVLQGKIRRDVITGQYSRNGERRGIFQLIKNPKTLVKHSEIPDFEVPLLDTEGTISKTAMKGTFYILDFWSTGCPPCVAEMPNLHSVYKKYSDKNFSIISLSLDQKPDAIRKFRETQWPMPWRNVHLDRGSSSQIVQDLQVRGTPTAYLVSPEGVILATTRELSGENLEQTLARFLADK